jgi:hypothetical protein
LPIHGLLPNIFSHIVRQSIESGLLILEEAESHINPDSYIADRHFGTYSGAITSQVVVFFAKKKPGMIRSGPI